MKLEKTFWLSVAGIAGLAASGASGQIAISEHNFSGTGWSQGQICLPCHTPHNAMEGMPRLWNHELTTATYAMHNQSYITPPIGNSGTAEANFDVASRMCLSCHDGTVALDSFGGTTGTSFIAAGNKANLGINLEDDHPVGTGAMYPPPNPPTFWSSAFNPATGTGGGSVGSLRLKDLTWNGTNYKVVGCTTCHNPHNRGNYEMDGTTLLQKLQQVAPQTPVVVMTAYGTVDSAVAAMRAGAADYVLKPVQFEDVLLRVKRALEFGEMRRDRRIMAEQLAAQSTFHNLIGESPAITRLFETARKLSTVRSSVLIVGESGTGKELFARAIHYNGITRDKPFVAVNCGAIPETLIESELFGHRKGAFTGAVRDRIGYFEAANGGTLFLDEISTLPLNVQSSLLRVLEERVVVPVGDTRPRPVDVRIIAASNQDLLTLVKQARFREDLLYRLDVVRLTLPPLRQRRHDIPLLVQHFLDKYTREMNKNVTGISNAAMRALLSHEWRGNVRELENVIERAVIFADGREIGLDDLPFGAGDSGASDDDLKDALAQFERQHIIYSLRRHRYDKAETAKRLGIGVSSLYRKLEELKIPKDLEQVDTRASEAPHQ